MIAALLVGVLIGTVLGILSCGWKDDDCGE